jgi:hypothetical protein
MLTKTKITLAAVLFAGSATAAMAAGYENVAHRSSPYADPSYSYDVPYYRGPVARAPYGTWQDSPVRLQDGRVYGPVTNPPVNENDWYDTDTHDKASSPFAGGGGL